MPKSNHGPKHKAKVKKRNILKQKQKQMENFKNPNGKMPISYTYHKDAPTVEVPMKAWQVINAMAKELQPLAMLVSTLEQVGQDHINDGTLIPVFQEDVEPEMKDGAPLLVNGQIQYKLRDSFWSSKTVNISAEEQPTSPASGIIVDINAPDAQTTN